LSCRLADFPHGRTPRPIPTVASVFRAGANGLGLNLYGSTSVSYSGGGAFVGTPAAASSGSGKVFAIALADAGWLGATTYQNGSWTGWNYVSGGYGTANVPAITVAPSGIAYVVVRDGSGNAYWLNSVSSAGTWSTWIGLGGIFSTDPTVAAAADGSIWIAGRAGSSPPDSTCPAGGCGAIWVARYVPGGAATFVSIQGTVRGKPHVTIGTDNAAYIVSVRRTHLEAPGDGC